MGMLCVDALSGEEFFRLSLAQKPRMCLVPSRVVFGLCGARLHKLCIILDDNPFTSKMQAQLAVHLEQMGLAKAITVKCLYVPSYSPKIELG